MAASAVQHCRPGRGTVRLGDRPPVPRRRGIVFVSGRCLFPYGAMPDIVSWWAAERGDRGHAAARVTEARRELARGTDREAVMRSLVPLFQGAEERDLVTATRSYLRSVACSSSLRSVTGTAGATDTEVVVMSDLVLFSLVEELTGVSALLSSSLVSVEGRLTGEVSRFFAGRERRPAMAEFAASRRTRLSECVLRHCGAPEDLELADVIGTMVDLRRGGWTR